MCLSIPGKIIAVDGKFASVDYGNQGIRENVNNSLVEGRVGNFVLVQGGFAIKILTESEAQEMTDALKIIETEFGTSEGMF
ncbi:MAG TPA: HypC/HybG/HupF family hydrogenase formation chaperone [Methylomirabilota bacterium]|nr:HypC/HybG/HupF family hydrogenase formation chaperone [Methylomirabilota bacterium]